MERLYRHPWLIVALIGAGTLFFAAQLPKTVLNNDVVVFMPQDHPAVLAKKRTDALFGDDQTIAVAIKARRGGLLTADNIKRLIAITRAIERIARVSKVSSLVNTDYIEGSSDGFKVSPILDADRFTGSAAEIEELKRRLLSWEPYKLTLYSKDFSATMLAVNVSYSLAAEAREQIYFEIERVLAGAADVFEYHAAGTPALTVLISSNMRSDLATLIPLVIIVVVGTLVLSFRRLGGVLLPLLTVLVSTVWTMGLMASLGLPLSILSTAIPVIMIAVGSAYGIHLVNDYYQELKLAARPLDEKGQRELIYETVKKVGLPVALAGLTTIAGFASNLTSSIKPIKEFGLFTSFGVLVALVVALSLVPAILILMRRPGPAPDSRPDSPANPAEGRLNRLILASYHFLCGDPLRLVLLTLAILGLALFGTSKLNVDNSLIDYFKPDSTIHRADRFIREHFIGTNSFNVTFKGALKGDLIDPDALEAMDELAVYLKSRFPQVTKIFSYADFVKRMNQVMHYEEAETAAPPAGEAAPAADPDAGGGGFSSFFSETRPAASPSPAESPRTVRSETARLDKVFTYRDFLVLLNDALYSAERIDLSADRLVREINRRMNYQGQAYYEIPTDPAKYGLASREELRNLIAQYLLLFSGNVKDYADDAIEPLNVKMSIHLNTTGIMFATKLVDEIKLWSAGRFPPGIELEYSGITLVQTALIDLIVNSQLWSILASLAAVFLILVASYRSIAAGLIGSIPLALAIVINFAVMGFTGITLDVSTAMVASVTVGIGVDYTIHFMASYRYNRLRTADLEEATRLTLQSSGRAIIFNAVSVGLGFAVLLLSQFMPLIYFGGLLAMTMATSSLAAMTILPVLLNLIKPKFISR